MRVLSTGLVAVWLPLHDVELLITSRALWDGKDELRYEKNGKLPPTRKIVRALIKKHIEIRKLEKRTQDNNL